MDEDDVTLATAFYIARHPRQSGADMGDKYKEEYIMRRDGKSWLHRVLDCPNEIRVFEDLGVCLNTFNDLCDELALHLTTNKIGNFEVKEMITTFLLVLLKGGGFGNAKAKLCKSKSTISFYFWSVCRAFFDHVYDKVVPGLQYETGGHPHVLNNLKYKPFGPVVGAGDGTYIATKGTHDASDGLMRCRKGFLARNLFAIADFNLYYLYCHLGGEGCANDPQILNKLLDDNIFKIPGNDRILLDAIYRSKNNMLTPYRSVRYHLKEWERSGLRPQTAAELYNLRHASLRSCIERAFGYTKNKFRILQSPLEFKSSMKQMLVLYCIIGLIFKF